MLQVTMAARKDHPHEGVCWAAGTSKCPVTSDSGAVRHAPSLHPGLQLASQEEAAGEPG